MLVLSNKQRIQGAVSILYPGVLEEISNKYQSDFYIIPSSIHEVILLKDSGRESVSELKQIIGEVNSTQVDAQEVLSDNLYYFCSGKKNLEIL